MHKMTISETTHLVLKQPRHTACEPLALKKIREGQKNYMCSLITTMLHHPNGEGQKNGFSFMPS